MALNFFDFLKVLNDISQRAPAATPALLEGMTDFSNGTKKFEEAAQILLGNSPLPQGHFKAVQHQPMKLSQAEQDMQKKVIDAIRKSDHPTAGKLKALGDGQLIQLIQLAFQFLNANPQIGGLIMTWLTKLLSGGAGGQPQPAPQV